MKKYILLLFVILLSFGNLAAEQTDKWNLSKSTHFIVYYKNAPREFISQLIDKAEDYYNKIADELGFRRFNFWLWDNRAKIYIYDNLEDYQASTGQPSWSGGCAAVREKTIKTFPYAKGFFETILAHEMGHIIFREFVGFDNNAIPLWLEEGVASSQEKLRYANANKLVKEAINKGYFIALENLPNSISTMNTAFAQLFYAQAFSVVNFLLKEYGRDNFVLFCQNLRDKKNLQRAMAASYPFSNIQELEQAWKKYIQNA